MDQDPSAYKDRWAWVDTSKIDIVGQHQIATIDLHMFVDFRTKVSSTTAFRVKTIEGPLTTSSQKFSIRSLSACVEGYKFVSVDLC